MRVYAAIRENGVIDIGLQSALDVGVKECDYIVVPANCMKTVHLGD